MHIWFVFHVAPTTINNFKLELCLKAQLGQVLMLFRVHRRLFIAILSASETANILAQRVGGSCLVTDAYVLTYVVTWWWGGGALASQPASTACLRKGDSGWGKCSANGFQKNLPHLCSWACRDESLRMGKKCRLSPDLPIYITKYLMCISKLPPARVRLPHCTRSDKCGA